MQLRFRRLCRSNPDHSFGHEASLRRAPTLATTLAGVWFLSSTVFFGVPDVLNAQQPEAPTKGRAATKGQDKSDTWQPDPALVESLSSRKNHPFNYRESEVPSFDLPSVLGEHGDRDAWERRRASLLDNFRQHVYGVRPDVEYSISFQDEGAVVDPTGGQAEGKRVICRIAFGRETHEFPFLLYLPRERSGQIPLVILINNREFPDPAAMKEEPSGFWPVDLIVKQGYATACFHTSDVDPDRADGYAEGVRGFLASGQPRQLTDWGSLSAWGWAASRVMDYAIENEPIDPSRVAVVGHSRGGKTALWAAAEDPRFAIAYSNESGCGGAALSRRRYGETIGRITSSFPHWFCPKLTEYTDKEPDLPVDQHQLIALLAPRAVYVASAAEDLWADPKGEYLSVLNSAPAYSIYGIDPISRPVMPPLDTPVRSARQGYHIRPGKHNLTRHDWEFFLDFAAGVFADSK